MGELDSVDQGEAKRQALQTEIDKGLKSGVAEGFDMIVLQSKLDEEVIRLAQRRKPDPS